MRAHPRTTITPLKESSRNSRLAAAAFLAAAIALYAPARGANALDMERAPLEGYRRMDLPCGPFVVYHDEGREEIASEIGRIVCGSAGEIAALLGLGSAGRVRIVIASSSGSFSALHGGRLPEWGEAFSDPSRMLIGIDASRVLRGERPLAEVVKHELSHIFLAQRTGGASCPFWFAEGLAMRQSGEWTLGMQWRLAVSAWRRDMPDLNELQGPFPRSSERAAMAYLLSYYAVDRLIGQRPERLATLTAFISKTGDFDRAFLLTYGETAGEFSDRVTADLESRYRKPAVLINASPYWLSLSAFFLLVYILKRRRSRKKIESWESEESGGRGGLRSGR